MRNLIVHNKYKWPVGEDMVVEQEKALLESKGHYVAYYEKSNNELADTSMLQMAQNCFWNPDAYADISRIIEQERIELMHVHNYFPILSPAIFSAAQKKKIAVVHTLHNFRLSCINGLFLRQGKPCEDCLSCGNLLSGVIHRCYRSDFAASSVAATSIGMHNLTKTIPAAVDRLIALNEHAREKFVQSGLPENKIAVKSNFILRDRGAGDGSGDYVAFLGRLAGEKGIEILLSAWKKMKMKIRLKIAGDGVLSGMVKEFARDNPLIEYMGWLEEADIHQMLSKAKLSIVPSIWYEAALPLSAIQSLCAGTPVVASRLGAMERLVHEGKAGLLFEPGNAQDLAEKIEGLYSDSDTLKLMRIESRKDFVCNYTAESNYELLIEIYKEALASARVSK